MRITALLAVRNEARYLPVTLKPLADCGIDLALIDHGSHDAPLALAEASGVRVVRFAALPYRGYFSLTEQVKAKGRLATELDTDWLIHVDADEILESPRTGETLRDGLERVAREGYEVVNFEEFVFVPTRQHPNHERGDFHRSMLSYYFFEKRALRLMRAWKNLPIAAQVDGGHRVKAERPLVMCPESFVMRHYLVLSQDHANAKYRERRFAPEDLAKGWHRSRLNVPPTVALPDESELERLACWNSKDFSRRSARKHHFWQTEWQKMSPAGQLPPAG